MKIANRFLFFLLISMLLFGCGDKTADIEGKIVDGKGKPVPGVSMIFKQVQPTQGYEQFETKTSADGSFYLKGVAPLSEYVITILSDKWRTKVTKKIKTLEAGQNLSLKDPIRIRFNQMNDGSVVDTKTGLQWLIYSVSDITADNVGNTVSNLKEGGYTDWRLPSRKDLSSLLEEKPTPKTPSTGPVFVNKTCCAWVIEPNSEVDWKFYVEEENELWASNKETPDNRIIVVRDSKSVPVAAPVAAAPVENKQTVTVPPAQEEAASNVQTESPAVKPPPGVRQASRKACAEKKAQAANLAKAEPVTTPVNTKDSAKVIDTKPAKIQEPVVPPAKKDKPVAPSITETVYFDLGSTTLKASELAKLKSLFKKISKEKGILIVNGHADASSGSKVSNFSISIERSSEVVNALNKMGINNNVKVQLRASGIYQPVATNDTDEGRKLNRRVDLSFMPE